MTKKKIYDLEERTAEKQKTRQNSGFFESTNLVQNSSLSSMYNTTRSEISVKSQLGRGDEGNRTPGLLDDKPESAPSHPHDENIIPQNYTS
jgi:hypothetical protein